MEALTSDPEVRHALADENVEKRPHGKGYRAHFWLTRREIEQTIELLEVLETRRISGDLPKIGSGTDDVIFVNAIVDLQECIGARY